MRDRGAVRVRAVGVRVGIRFYAVVKISKRFRRPSARRMKNAFAYVRAPAAQTSYAAECLPAMSEEAASLMSLQVSISQLSR